MTDDTAERVDARVPDAEQLLQALGNGVYGMDRDGRCTFANRSALTLLGYEAAEALLGRDMHALVHHTRPDGTAFLAGECPLLRTLAEGEVVTLDEELLWRRDGTSFYAEYASRPVVADGVVIGGVVTFGDLSHRRDGRRRLAMQQEVSQILAREIETSKAQAQALAAIGAGFGWDAGALWLVADPDEDPRGRLLRAAVWHGDGAGRSVPAFGDEADALPTRALAERTTVLAEAPPVGTDPSGHVAHAEVAFPIQVRDRDIGVVSFRSRRPIELAPGSDRAFETLGRQLGQFLERRRAEARLRDSETRKAAIMQTALDGIVVIGENTRIVEFNPAAERTFGWSEGAAMGQELGALILPADFLVGHLRTFARFLEDGETSAMGRHVEVEAERSDGERFPAELAVTPFKADGKPMFTVYLRDITERKRAEREVAAARDEALDANRAKSQFLANMSHELRTPLSAIIGYSEMLQEEMQDGGDPEAFAPDMAKVESNARHLLGLINDVLDLSKIESGKMEIYPEEFDAEAMVRDVAATVSSLVDRKGNVLALRIGPGLGTMRSDLTKVKQMLLNLLSNASKFIEGGTIALSVECVAAGDGPARVRFEVRDSGIGMTEEQMGKLFQRFAQAEASISGKFGGTGLGLSISKAFAVMLGGDITVASAEGHGSIFTIVLPVAGPA